MERKDGFIMNGDRYMFDNGVCAVAKGFAQIDTTQDAWYYGMWTNPTTRVTISYTEGDVCRLTAENDEEYVKYLRELCACDFVKAIDPMLSEKITSEFVRLGITDLLHLECRPEEATCQEKQ